MSGPATTTAVKRANCAQPNTLALQPNSSCMGLMKMARFGPAIVTDSDANRPSTLTITQP